MFKVNFGEMPTLMEIVEDPIILLDFRQLMVTYGNNSKQADVSPTH